MSQQEPNSPESRNQAPEPQTSVPQSQVLSKILAFLRIGTIRVLRTTIRGLEWAAETLEAQPDTNQTLVNLQTNLSRLWQRGLTIVRARLPESLNQKLNDRALTGIVASLVVVGFWFTSNLFSAKPTPPQVAKRPVAPQFPKGVVVDRPTKPTEPFPSDLTAPEPIPAPEIAVALEPTPPETPIPVEPEAPEPTPEVAVSPTPEVEPMPEVTPTPEPPVVQEPPAPELTPEQQRIAAVQTEVNEISDRFISGLVESVQLNFDRHQLRVTVSMDWFRFSAQQQDQFANALFERSQLLDLDQLAITDAKGTLLARPPVVGSDMIVLKRRQIA